jgi:hypothetical protein
MAESAQSSMAALKGDAGSGNTLAMDHVRRSSSASGETGFQGGAAKPGARSGAGGGVSARSI